MAETAVQLNRFAESIEYIDMPYAAFDKNYSGSGKDKLTCSAYKLLCLIDSIGTTRKDPNGSARLTYHDFHDILGSSTATTSRSISALTEKDLVEQDKSDRSRVRYRIKKELPARKGFVRLDFPLLDFIKETFKVHLTPLEAVILSFMIGISMKDDKLDDGDEEDVVGKYEDKVYRGSYGTVGKALNLDDDTARKAIKKMVKAHVFHCPKGYKGDSAANPSRYILDTKVVRKHKNIRRRRKNEAIEREARREEERRAQESRAEQPAKPKDKRTLQEIAFDKESERKHYYAVLQQTEEELADRHMKFMMNDREFKIAEKRKRWLEFELGKAMAYNPARMRELQKEYDEVLLIRLRRLDFNGLTEADLKPRFKCPLCEDTGYRKDDGRECGCYPKSRGRP